MRLYPTLTLVVLFGFPSPNSVSLKSARANESAQSVQVEQTEDGAKVSYGGELFAQYLKRSGTRPIVWPIIGPTGDQMTRGYPMQPATPDEKTDHQHHRSLWFGHEGIVGTNTWTEPADGKTLSGHLGEQVHREFKTVKSDGKRAVICTVNDWRDAEGNKVCEDERTLTFFANDEYRWIDFAIELRATEGDVNIGETKEGTFAMRVPGTMKIDAKQGGHALSSRGKKDGEAWGRSAEWVDYWGPVGGQIVGIAIMSHPSNFRPAPRWHVREYGLFAANPFGEESFPPPDDYKQGPYTIPKGDSLKLRYRVILHRGDSVEGEVAERFKEFANDGD